MHAQRFSGRLIRSWLFMTLVGTSALLPACSGSTSSSPSGGNNAANGEGLPCDVTKVLQDRCWSCHGATPAAGAPMALVSYDDLVAPGKTNAMKTAAELSVERMKSPYAPMPPAGGVTADEIAVLEAWVAAGSPKGDCQNPGNDPFGGEMVCTSDQTWTYGSDVGDFMAPQMNPGQACIACHSTPIPGEFETPPIFLVAGTVYPTAHEPDNCYGLPDAQSTSTIVQITDSANNTYDLPVNATGNFMLFPGVAFVPPYSATVVSSNGERAMSAKQTSGDCNACHTAEGGGASMAPGRIVAP